MTESRPIREFRVCGTITASVWANEVQHGDRTVINYSVTLRKRYYDKTEKAWKTSSSFFPDELPKARLALRLAYEWIMLEAKTPAPVAA